MNELRRLERNEEGERMDSTMGARSTRPAILAGLGFPLHAVLRIGTGLLFMQHGVQKLFGWLGGLNGEGATAELFSLLGLAGVLEFVGGIVLVAGLFTRPVALVLMLEMVAAYFIGHHPRGGFPVQSGGELALLYALVFAYLAANGAGPASLDALLGRAGAADRIEASPGGSRSGPPPAARPASGSSRHGETEPERVT